MLRRLGGRYELQEQVGGGGMAVVYKALDTMLGRTVAVKMLRSQYMGDEEFVARFRQEAQSAARLSHPNIVNIYDIGLSEGEYYIVMEYVDGSTLKEIIREEGPIPTPRVLDITSQICDALDHAHDHHIIHRDIKPHNILITKSGRVKVTDFGIARAITGNTITHQPNGSVLGSVHYFSPEQARGGTTDAKSDIYSLGVVMYEMLTGNLPFSGDSPVSVALKHLRDGFVEPRAIMKDIPQSVENIVLRCLVKSPEYRYQDMKAVKADLKDALIHPNVPKFVAPREVSDETIALTPVSIENEAAEQPSAGRKAKQPAKRRWWMPLVWTGVTVVVLCIGAYAAYTIVMQMVQVPNLNMPNLVGKPEKQAVTALVKAGFSKDQIHFETAVNAKYKKGVIYSQDPVGPQEVKQNRTITLYVSNGQPKVQMPSLVGLPYDQAVLQLENIGVAKTDISEKKVPSGLYSAGSVADSSPGEGQAITPGDQVVLYVSVGSQVKVPDVTGMTLDQATTALQNDNLQVGQLYYTPHAGVDQTVFDTNPQVGQSVATGTAVDLYIVDNTGESGGGTGNSVSPSQNNTTGIGNNAANNAPGNSTANATTNTISGNASQNTSGSGPQQPMATQVKPVDVKVNDPDGSTLNIQIYKTDESGTMQQVVSETIRQTKTWTINMLLSPTTKGEILVYENARLIQDSPIKYGN